MITISAPEGIGEVTEQTDLAAVILAAVGRDCSGPLADGDIVVVTSKIISKHEGRTAPAEQKPQVLRAETMRTVARRGRFAIVETRHGLVQAAAGVDASNVRPELILTLPVDPDASARRLHAELTRRTGVRLGVIISDTSGRAWRLGQTDHAIGLHGVRAMLRYQGVTDAYGNSLQVTAMAVADELAGAADLVKAKLGGRPVAVVRGLGALVGDPDTDGTSDGASDSPALPTGAGELRRPVHEDLFRLGTRESVIDAVAAVTGHGADLEELFELDGDDLAERLADGLDPSAAALVRSLVEYATRTSPSSAGG